MNFKPGEVCDIVADHGGRYPEIVGLECTILEVYSLHETSQGETWGWAAVVPNGRQFIFMPGELRRKKDGNDGRRLTTWDEDVLGAPSPFNPTKENVT